MRYRRVKRDANHAEIVAALKGVGATVLDLAAVGGGCPDLLVGFKGRNTLLELKNPENAKVGGKAMQGTKDKQHTFRSEWQGLAFVVTRSADALDAIGASDRRLQA